MISKPAVAKVPIIVTATGQVSASPREVVAIHYFNTTAGAGRVDISDGETNQGITLGAAAVNQTDSFTPCQPMNFKKIIVTFTTGTGVVNIVVN